MNKMQGEDSKVSSQLFVLPELSGSMDWIEAIREHYHVQIGTAVHADWVCLDTFDNRLSNKSYVLWHDGQVVQAQSTRDTATCYQAETSVVPVFSSDLPTGELHCRIAPLLDVRALIARATLHRRHIPIRLLNTDDKTVLSLEFEQFSLGSGHRSPSLSCYLRLCPVRGYPKSQKGMRTWLIEQGAERIQEPMVQHVLTRLDLPLQPYSAKLQFAFDPLTPAEMAMKSILGFLLQVMRANEAGIIEDIDTEFLHDYRVAVRRSRAALSQIKGVFSEPITARYKRDFAYLGKCTTRLRDLDVYLLQEDDYRAKLPTVMQNDITPLFDYLRRERRRAHQLLVRQLRSKRYAELMQRWESFVESPLVEPARAPSASLAIGQVARKRIRKKSRAVRVHGKELLHSSDDVKLHDFRIECKKLRYLMEFFTSLFTKTPLKQSIKHVKALQDTLGDYNDLCVQQEALNMWAEPIARQPNGHRAVLAMGHLIGLLEVDKQALQQQFPEAFETFVSNFSLPSTS